MTALALIGAERELVTASQPIALAASPGDIRVQARRPAYPITVIAGFGA